MLAETQDLLAQAEALAMLELCLVVASIAQRFHFTKEPTVTVLPSITLHPKEGIQVQINRRAGRHTPVQ